MQVATDLQHGASRGHSGALGVCAQRGEMVHQGHGSSNACTHQLSLAGQVTHSTNADAEAGIGIAATVLAWLGRLSSLGTVRWLRAQVLFGLEVIEQPRHGP